MRWVLLLLVLWPLPAQAATYYTSKSGSNANSCATAQNPGSDAKGTINGGIACLSSGDTLLVQAGVYNEVIADTAGLFGYIVRPPNGTSWSSLTTIKSEVKHGAVLSITSALEGGWNAYISLDFPNTQYLHFDGFKMLPGPGMRRVVSMGGPENIRYSHLHGTRLNTFGGEGPGLENPTNIEFVGTETYDYGYDASGNDTCDGCGSPGCPGFCHGYYLYGGPYLFDGITVDHVSGYGIQMYGFPSTVRNSHFEDTYETGVGAFAGNMTVYNTTFLRTTGSSWFVGGGNNFLGNTVHLMGRMCAMGGGLGAGIYDASGGTVIKNNLLTQQCPGGSDKPYLFVNNGSFQNALLQGVNPATVAGNMCDHPNTVGCTAVSAGSCFYQDANGGNLHACASSPAINAGVALGSPFDVDKDGAARPFGGAWDVGAYEFGGVLAEPTDFYVATWGDDEATGAQSTPWRTVQRAADTIGPGDTVHIGPGTFGECVTFPTSGTSGQPITFQGTVGSGGVLETVIDCSTPAGGWVPAPEVGSGVWKTAALAAPEALTSQGRTIWKIHDTAMAGSVLPGTDGTGNFYLARAANAQVSTPLGLVNYWDGIEALWGKVGGVTYLRFRNGTDPATLGVRAAPAGATLLFSGTSFVTLRHLRVQGGEDQIRVTAGASNLTLDTLSVGTGTRRIVVDGTSTVTITNSTLAAEALGMVSFTPGAAHASRYARVVNGHMATQNATIVGNGTAPDISLDITGGATQTVFTLGTIEQGITGVKIRGTSTMTRLNQNTLRFFALAAVDIQPTSATYQVFANLLQDTEHGVRVGAVHVPQTGYVYANRFWAPDAGAGGNARHVLLLHDTPQPNNSALWIYQNSYAGAGYAVDVLTTGGVSSLPNVHVLNNLISTDGLTSGPPPTGWETANNYLDTLWYTAVLPDFILPGGHPALQSAPDLGPRGLPGMTAAYYVDGQPDHGALQGLEGEPLPPSAVFAPAAPPTGVRASSTLPVQARDLFPTTGLVQLPTPVLTGLRAWWRVLPQRFGGRVLWDLLGRAHLDLVNMPYHAFAPTTRPGGHGEIQVRATNAYLSAGPRYAHNGPFTAVLWARNAADTGHQDLMGHLSPTWTQGWGLHRFGNTNKMACCINTQNNCAIQPGTWALNTWTQVACTWSGSTLSLYLNGVLQQSLAATSAYPTGLELTVGGLPQYNAGGWWGSLDDVMLFDRPLTASTLVALRDLAQQGWPGLLRRTQIPVAAVLTPPVVVAAPRVLIPWASTPLLAR